MKRRIVFRGYNLKNKKWLYGYYLVNRGKHYIVQDEVVDPFAEESDFEVDPESVGQFVGDYFNKEVYEGDIVQFTYSYGFFGENISKEIGVITFNPDTVLFYAKSLNGDSFIELNFAKKLQQFSCDDFAYEVIGNEYEENIKSFQSIEKKVLDDWHKLDEEIFSKQHELIMENRKR